MIIVFDVEGADEIADRYDDLAYRTTGPAMADWMQRVVAPFLQTRATRRFASEGDDASGKWEQLAIATRLIRRNMGFPPAHPINVRTGDLRDFVINTENIASTAQTATLQKPGKTGTSRLTEQKLRVAQRGGLPPRAGKTRGKAGPNRPAPPRPVAAINRTDEDFIFNRLVAWMLK